MTEKKRTLGMRSANIYVKSRILSFSEGGLFGMRGLTLGRLFVIRLGRRRYITGKASGRGLLSKCHWLFRWHWRCGLSIIFWTFG